MMKRMKLLSGSFLTLLLASLLAMPWAGAVEIQPVAPQKPYTPLTPAALEELVGPIALYPDDLVAVVLPASTFPLQVVQAARFREQTPDGKPSERWDGSVVALLNYPEVLKKLNTDLDWTWRLGEAVINQQPDVLKAVSSFRERARVAGNLKSDNRQVVEVREKIVYIRPVSERVIYVPYYDPWEVTRYGSRHVYHYYPTPFPVYYYPYDDYWDFPSRHFWGVSSWYGIGWHHHRLHWLHHEYRRHPYYGRSYRDHGHWRRYRHQEAPAYVNEPVGPVPVIAEGSTPGLPEDSVWQPGQQAGSRPFGDRQQHTENPVGPSGDFVNGIGSESGVSVPGDVGVAATTGAAAAGAPVAAESGSHHSTLPESASALVVTPAQTADTPVVYEGDVNGKQVRIIQRGSNFEREVIDEAPAVHRAPEPVIHQAPEPAIVESPAAAIPQSSTYGVEHEAAVQAAIERARQESRDQAESWRQERSGGFEAPVIERRVEEYRSDPVIERHGEITSQPVYEESPRFEPTPAPEPSVDERSFRRSFEQPSWSRPQEEAQDWRREQSFEAPVRDWDRESDSGSRFEPQQEQRSEPAWQPERQEEIQIEDIRVEGHQ